MKKPKKHYKKYISLYVPRVSYELLHIKLERSKPKFKYEIESFYGILHDIANATNKEVFDNRGWVPLYSLILKSKYGNDYLKYLTYLSNRSIITSSTTYDKGSSYHYKLNIGTTALNCLNKEIEDYNINTTLCFQYNTLKSIITINNKGLQKIKKAVKKYELIEIKIDKTSRLGKKIIAQYNKDNDTLKHSAEHLKKIGSYFKSNFNIDDKASIKFIEESLDKDLRDAKENEEKISVANNKFIHRRASILAIVEGRKNNTLRFKRNRTNKRLDTNLTNMAGDLRKFIADYENLSYLDLANSQPVLFNEMLLQRKEKAGKILKKEIDEYYELTMNGGWYEFLMKIYKVDRDTAKKRWMEIAYSKNKSWKGHKKKFAQQFPQINKIIIDKKVRDHADFAVGLQKTESKIFIDEICKELVAVDIIPYTMHDGLLVPKEREEETYQIMTKVLAKHLGGTPVISINDTKRYPNN